jgi:hypothetical protein
VSQLVLTSSLDKETGGCEFTLNYVQPERNHGLFAMIVMNVVGDERLDAIAIIKPLYDLRDAKEETMFNAKLLPNRTGIEVTEPSLPFYLQNCIKDVVNNTDKQFLKSTTGGLSCKATALEYKSIFLKVSIKEQRQQLFDFPTTSNYATTISTTMTQRNQNMNTSTTSTLIIDLNLRRFHSVKHKKLHGVGPMYIGKL